MQLLYPTNPTPHHAPPFALVLDLVLAFLPVIPSGNLLLLLPLPLFDNFQKEIVIPSEARNRLLAFS
jgi:hypothetical protein